MSMIPSSLSNYVNPVLDKALETGARGQTTTETNYGVIGDAFFKKAQLDLDMAQLQTNVEMNIGNMQMDAAKYSTDLELNKAQMAADYHLKNEQLNLEKEKFKYEKKQNEPSFFEQILGAASGAASGAAIGSHFGPQGALIGGVLGGVTSFGAAQQGGRVGMSNANSMMGNIASASEILFNNNKERTNKDTWDSLLHTAQSFLRQSNDPSLSAEERQVALDKYNTNMQDMFSFQVSDMKLNPEQAAKNIQSFDSVLRQGGSTDTGREAGQLEMSRHMTDFASKVHDAKDPSEERRLINEYRGKMAQSFVKANGGNFDADEFNEFFDTQVNSLDGFSDGKKALIDGIDTRSKPRSSSPTIAPDGTVVESAGDVTMAPRKGNGLTPTQRAGIQRDNTTPQDIAMRQNRAIPNQGNQSPSAPIIGVRGDWRPPLTQGAAVQMDDGGEFNANKMMDSILDTNKMGAEAVKTLEKGNIDLDNRKVVNNKDGSISTEKSITIEEDGKYINIPTIINGKEVSEKQAIQYYHKTGEHLGKYNDLDSAESAAQSVHERQDQKYSRQPQGNDATDQDRRDAVKSTFGKIRHNLSLSDEEFDSKRDPLFGDKPQPKTQRGANLERFDHEHAEINRTLDENLPVLAKGDAKDQKQYSNAAAATKGIDEMIELVKSDKVPTGSQRKGFGARVREDGVNVGGAVGGAVGAAGGAVVGSALGPAGTVSGAVKGGAVGATAGAYAGDKAGIRVGKGSGIFLSDSEEEGIDRINAIKQNTIMNIAKAQDPGGRVAKDDYDNLESKFYDPGKSKAANIASLLQMKREVANSVEASARRVSMSSNTEKSPKRSTGKSLQERLHEQEALFRNKKRLESEENTYWWK